MYNPTLAELLGAVTNAQKPQKEAPFESFTVYFNEHYIGNFSLPSNFSDTSKATVLGALKAKGLELRTPGATKRELTAEDLGIQHTSIPLQ